MCVCVFERSSHGWIWSICKRINGIFLGQPNDFINSFKSNELVRALNWDVLCAEFCIVNGFAIQQRKKQRKENTKCYSVKITTMNTYGNYQMIAGRHFIQQRIHYDYLHLSINSNFMIEFIYLLNDTNTAPYLADCGTAFHHHEAFVPHCCKLNRRSHRHSFHCTEYSRVPWIHWTEQHFIPMDVEHLQMVSKSFNSVASFKALELFINA